jgi:solute carrier family 35 protein E3
MEQTFFGASMVVMSNIGSAVVLILVNKRVVTLHKFRFMSVLSGIHFYFSFITCLILMGFGMIHYKPVNNYLHLLRIALGSLGSIIFMNYNLATNSIGFYQTSKLSCIPITLMIETILNKRQQNLSLKMVFSLFLILLGMGLVAVNEISFNIEGTIWAICAVIFSSCAQIFFGPLQRELNLNALQMLFWLSPIMTLGKLYISVCTFCMSTYVHVYV